LQLIAPGITVRAVPNDVPLNILRPAELISLSEYPSSWPPEQHDVELALPHGLLIDVTVDQNGQMVGYQIISARTASTCAISSIRCSFSRASVHEELRPLHHRRPRNPKLQRRPRRG